MSEKTSLVYTVGHEGNYDAGILAFGEQFKKLGRTPNYSGGFACKSIEDADRLIDEMNKRGEWAIYRLEADWDRDTVPSEDGWWHSLINSSHIVEKVEPVQP